MIMAANPPCPNDTPNMGYARKSPIKLTGMSSTTISGTLNDSNNEAQIMKITSTTTNMSAVRCLCSLHQP